MENKHYNVPPRVEKWACTDFHADRRRSPLFKKGGTMLQYYRKFIVPYFLPEEHDRIISFAPRVLKNCPASLVRAFFEFSSVEKSTFF